MRFLGYLPFKVQKLSPPSLIIGQNENCNHGRLLIRSLTNHGPWDSRNHVRKFDQIEIIPFIEENLNNTNKAHEICKHIYFTPTKYGKPKFESMFDLNRVSLEDPIFFNQGNLNEQMDHLLVDYPPNSAIERIPIVLSNDFKNQIETKVYYKTKKKFIKNGLATQHISLAPESMTIKQFKNREWQYVIRNMQLQIYSKSSGIPWIINSRQHYPNLIIGLGYSKKLPPDNGFAFATLALFESNGRWANMVVSPDFVPPPFSKGLFIPKEHIKPALRDILIEYRRIASEEDPWISIHKNGRFQNDEAEEISLVLSDLGYKCELLEITRSNFRLAEMRTNNYYPITQFSWIKLTDYSGFLVNTGAGVSSIGTPVVLYIKRHRQSTIDNRVANIEVSANVVSDMTFMGWRSFFAEGYQLPASTDLARKAAQLIKHNIQPADRLKGRPWYS